MSKKRLNRRKFLGRALGAAALSAEATEALADSFSGGTSGRDSTAHSSAARAACPAGQATPLGDSYKPRYPGPRWQLVYGSYDGVETFCVNELQRAVQGYVPYVVEVVSAQNPDKPTGHVFLVGTAANNPRIAELVDHSLISIPNKAESYACACFASPWNAERKCVVIAGSDSVGVRNGVMHFNKRLAGLTPAWEKSLRPILDGLAPFNARESPAIDNRGLWSWGYVIYDYRRFIDNMARLRMNRLLFWNDVPPLNCQAVIDHAHSRGIKVVLGFPWGWGMEKLDPTSASDREEIKADVLCRVDAMCARLNPDAIYFQTFTETRKQEIGGRPLASFALDWVGDIAGTILARHPNLRIEWGLHATSILQSYKLLEKLDPRIVIVWEDAGVIPYSYDPVARSTAVSVAESLNDPAKTLDYSRQLATFRPGSEFAMVAKGWTTLGWKTEFEHHRDFILGERSQEFIRARLDQKHARWDQVNRWWLENYPYALQFYRGILDTHPSAMTVLGLIEDGLFEEKVQFSAALFAETLWNPRRQDEEILAEARNPYYSRIA